MFYFFSEYLAPRMNVQSETADKRKAILQTTLELIRQYGLQGTPISLIAKNANVAAGTIYHYFESKEQLICALYQYNRERVVSVISAALKGDDRYKDKFFRVWNSLYQFYVHEPNVLIFFEQFVNSPFNVDKYPNHFRGELYDFLSEGIKQKVVRSLKPEILLVLLMGSINASAKLHLFGKVPLTKQDLNRITEILWDGITGSPVK